MTLRVATASRAARDDNSVELLAEGLFASFRRSKNNRMSLGLSIPREMRQGLGLSGPM